MQVSDLRPSESQAVLNTTCVTVQVQSNPIKTDTTVYLSTFAKSNA